MLRTAHTRRCIYYLQLHATCSSGLRHEGQPQTLHRLFSTRTGGQAARGGKDPYSLLGVKSTASGDEIKAAFRTKALKMHPDVRRPARSKAEEDKKNEEFVDLLEAVAILGDNESRSAYVWDEFSMLARSKEYLRRDLSSIRV